jgi:hypothetical protein
MCSTIELSLHNPSHRILPQNKSPKYTHTYTSPSFQTMSISLPIEHQNTLCPSKTYPITCAHYTYKPRPKISKVGGIITSSILLLVHALTPCRTAETALPSLLPREALIQQHQHLTDIKLDILEIQILLVVFLHLQQIIKLEIKLEQAAIAAFVV